MFNREKLNRVYKWWLAIDKTLFMLVVLLIISGMIFIGSASPSIAIRLGIDSNWFIKKHFVFALGGIFLMAVISTLSVKQIEFFANTGTAFCILLLILTLFLGFAAKGAKRWLYLFGFSIQPTEILKPLFITSTAYLLTAHHQEEHLKKLIEASIPFIFIVFLVLLQPDIGTIILISTLFAIQLFIAGLPLIYFLVMGIGGGVFAVSAYLFIPHVTDRINRFLASLLSISEANYQVSKSLKAYSAGGLLGRGPMEGTIKNSIPDAHTDFIFAVIGEEFGLFFCIVLLGLFFYITFRVILKMKDETNAFKYLAVIGLISQFIIQAVINIGVTLNLLPTKGMTLPFISYGGSSLLGMSITFGIILALTRNTYKKKRQISEIILDKI